MPMAMNSGGAKGSVFVTGATGFIGARVTRFLLDRGYRVAALLRNPAAARRIAGLLPDLDIVVGDLLDPTTYADQLERNTPEQIVHLGWLGVGAASRDEPSQYRNIAALTELMELAVRAGVRHFVGVGSQAEYGPHQGQLDESASTAPTTLYGAAKLASYVLAERRLARALLPFAWLRVFSTFGPDDDPNTMISYLARSLLRRERPRLTAGEQRWDYLFVDDAAQAIVDIVDVQATGVFNLGSGEAHVLRQVVESVRDLIDPSLPLGFGEIAYKPDQVMHLEANIGKLRQATGWRPKHSIKDGLSATVEWTRSAS